MKDAEAKPLSFMLCREVTNIGHYGTGDAEVGLRSLDELPYIMGLVRQSLERQMGNGGEA